MQTPAMYNIKKGCVTALSTEPICHWQTASMGKLVVGRLRFKNLADISKEIHKRKVVSASDLIDLFIATLAQTEAGQSLTAEQIRYLPAAEKEDFAEQLLKAEDYGLDPTLTLVANSLPTLRRPAMGRTRERQDDLHCKRPHD